MTHARAEACYDHPKRTHGDHADHCGVEEHAHAEECLQRRVVAHPAAGANTHANHPDKYGYVSHDLRRSDSTVDPDLVFQVIMAAADIESQNAAAAHTTVARLGATHPDAPRNREVAARSMAEGVGPRTESPAIHIAREVIGGAVLAIIRHGADPATELARAETAYIERATQAGHL